MEFESIICDQTDGIVVLTLNRPDRLNALNTVMRREVRQVLRDVNEDPQVRVLIITGFGDRAFCAGADQRERSNGGAISAEEIKANNLYPERGLAGALFRLEKPVIVAVNGVCVGGGMAFACGGDICIASEKARFKVGHAPLGMGMQDGLGWLLPRRIGAQRAFELYATNRLMDAEEAERVGLIMKVVPGAVLQEEAMKLARLVTEAPPLGLLMTKRAIREGERDTLSEYMVFERLAYQVCYFSEDSKEARRAFLDDRRPEFLGK